MNGPREILAEFVDGECLCADGFDDAIIGTVSTFGGDPVVLYDRDKCIEILIEEGMTHEDAEDHFCFNVEGSYVGERTPMFAVLLKHYEELTH
jgi:hypothetical protein